MAKKTQRRASAARDQLGCMWGFMNMFTFRHGPLSHKLFLEPKHAAAGSPRNNERDKSKCHDKDAQETHVGEEGNVTITIIKPSVKKLIAEELFNDKKQRENAAEAGQLSDSELEGRRRKNHKRKNKTRKNSCGDFSHILKTADTEVPKVNRRTTKKSHHGCSERSLDIDNMVEEFCSEMHRRRSGKNGMLLNHKHGQDYYKEKLRELVKFLISQKKLLHGENSEILTSKDLMEVFQILGSDEDLFLKLLQDPEILVPADQSRKGEESLSLTFERTGQSSLADKRWFRRKKDTPQQEVTDDDDKECEDRIFILKPRSASFSSLSSHDSHLMRNKTHDKETNTSHFFLSEIKRKLKQAIRKEQPGLQLEGYPKNVPTKDHFFIERMAKPSTKSQRKKKHYDDDDKKQRVSNIYIEAKKHLSEMLNNGDVVVSNSTSRQVQNSSLGTILSLPEYLSPLSSPWEKSSPTHRKSASADFINAVHITKREPHVSPPENTIKNDDLEVCDLNKDADNSLQPTASEPADKSVDIEDGTANEDKISAEGPAVNEIDIVPEEASSTLLSDLSKAEAHDENRDGIISKQASHEERQPPPLSPSVASPSHCLAKGEECKSAAHDVPEWSSPISVLEPLFIEDDISPPKMRSQSDDEAQKEPWCIHFDDKEDSAVKTIITSDKELVFKYVRDVLDAVVSDFEELYLKAQFSDQLLEPSLISNIPFCPNQLCHDHELLFDCINEVIMELCCCPPWASFVAPRRTRVFSTVKNIIHEVQGAVYWHLTPLPLPHALDQIVRKDMAKAGNWLDIRCDIDSIGFETSELILEELLEELITLNCLDNTNHSLVPAEMKTDESMILVL